MSNLAILIGRRSLKELSLVRDEDLLVGLSIVVRQQGVTTTIALDREWDLAQREKTHDAVQTALARQPDRVVLDLRRLTFMDATGVHGVLELARHAARLKIDPW